MVVSLSPALSRFHSPVPPLPSYTYTHTDTHAQHAIETAKKKAELELSGCTFSPALEASSQEMIDQL